MLYFFSGTDRNKARAEANAFVQKNAKKHELVRLSDAHSPKDLLAALAGGGMFSKERVVVLDGVIGNPEMEGVIIAALPQMKDSDDVFILLEGKIDAATKKQIEKYAEESRKFDAVKGKDGGSTIFALANALRKGDKKALWVGYQRELKGSAPEAIHGVFFWAAKQMFLQSRAQTDRARAKKMIATLAELPHLSRRRGVELEYSLEQFVLSIA